MVVFIVARHMRPEQSRIRDTASRRQRHPLFRLTEPMCRREPIDRPVLRSIPPRSPRLLQRVTPVSRKSTLVQHARIRAIKATEAPIAPDPVDTGRPAGSHLDLFSDLLRRSIDAFADAAASVAGA